VQEEMANASKKLPTLEKGNQKAEAATKGRVLILLGCSTTLVGSLKALFET
jgi:hypothetical protein